MRTTEVFDHVVRTELLETMVTGSKTTYGLLEIDGAVYQVTVRQLEPEGDADTLAQFRSDTNASET